MTDHGTHVSDEEINGTLWRITAHEGGDFYRAVAEQLEPVEAKTLADLRAKIEELG